MVWTSTIPTNGVNLYVSFNKDYLNKFQIQYDKVTKLYPYNQYITKTMIEDNRNDIDSIRDSIGALESGLEETYGVCFRDLMTKENIKENGYYTDTWNEDSKFCASDFIEIKETSTYSFWLVKGISVVPVQPIVSVWDASKNRVLDWTSSKQIYQMFTGAKYIRVSTQVVNISKIIICEGTTQPNISSLKDWSKLSTNVIDDLNRGKMNVITNVFNPNDENVEVGTIYASGVALTGQGNNWCTTGYIPCTRNESFTIINKEKWENWITYYDSDKNIVSYIVDITQTVFTVPDNNNIRYARFSLHTSNGIFDNKAIYNTKECIPTFYEYGKPILWTEAVYSRGELLNNNLDNLFENEYYKYACGDIICFGDSLTDGLYANTSKGLIKQNYPYYLGRMLNAGVTNAGLNGSCPSECYTSILPTYDITLYDTAIIWLGTNGGLFSSEINTDGTEANYYCKIIEYLKSKKPDIKIFIGKVFTTGELHTGVKYASVSETNTVIETIVDKYGLSVIDFSDLTTRNHIELHANIDNTHFGKVGNMYIANRITKHMINYFLEDISRIEFGLLTKQKH